MLDASPGLFDTPILPGLGYCSGIVTADEEAALIEKIEAQPLSPFRFQGWLGKRLTLSFGWHYDFDTAQFGAVDPIPDWLEPIRRRATEFSGLAEDDFVQALLIRYDPGAGIGWHRDRPLFDQVAGISLGAPATMRFRRRRDKGFERASVALASRSIYHLSGEARHDWEHSIAKMAETRWSVTFRSLSEKGRKTARSNSRLEKVEL